MGLFSKKNNEIQIPGNAQDKRLSAIYSAYKQPGTASKYLLELGLNACQRATTINLEEVSKRIPAGDVNYIDIFPGEHYKLLAALVDLLQPKLIVELGTHLGYSALCMKKYLQHGKLMTFDVVPWNGFPETILKESDFDGQLIQHVADITDENVFRQYQSTLEEADIIFMDAMKDGVQEYQFLKNFSGIQFKQKCLFVFDDIRLWNMLDIWFNMNKPKLDLTSFGHWSGTGLVEWN